MATLTVALQALAHIRETIAAESMAQPVVMVAWNPGDVDLSRGPKGEAVWQRGKKGWVAFVADLAEVGPVSTAPVEISGVSFILALRPTGPSLEGCELRVKGDRLVIEQVAI